MMPGTVTSILKGKSSFNNRVHKSPSPISASEHSWWGARWLPAAASAAMTLGPGSPSESASDCSGLAAGGSESGGDSAE